MKLERWNLNRYRAPYLKIHAIERTADSLKVDARHGTFRLACDDESVMDEVLLPMLTSLRSPGH